MRCLRCAQLLYGDSREVEDGNVHGRKLNRDSGNAKREHHRRDIRDDEADQRGSDNRPGDFTSPQRDETDRLYRN